MIDVSILVLATWRISKLLSFDLGPYNILERLRCKLGVRYTEDGESYGTTELSKMILCVYCNSVWLAFFVVLVYSVGGNAALWALSPFALSGAVIVLEELANG